MPQPDQARKERPAERRGASSAKTEPLRPKAGMGGCGSGRGWACADGAGTIFFSRATCWMRRWRGAGGGGLEIGGGGAGGEVLDAGELGAALGAVLGVPGDGGGIVGGRSCMA